jgi:hypothetical protein
MPKPRLSVPVALSPLVLVAVLAGCGGGTSTTTVTTSAPATTPTTTAAPVTAPAKTSAPAVDESREDSITVKGHTGDGLTLLGQYLTAPSGGAQVRVKVKVTLVGVRGPFSGFDVAAGRKLMGFEVRVTNLGTKVFDDPLPSGEVTLVDGDQGKQTNLIVTGRESPCKNPSLKLKQGQTKQACIAFEVPKSGKLQTFRFAVDSGYGDAGLWRLR